MAPHGAARRARRVDRNLDLPQSTTPVTSPANGQFRSIRTTTIGFATIWISVGVSVAGNVGVAVIGIAWTLGYGVWWWSAHGIGDWIASDQPKPSVKALMSSTSTRFSMSPASAAATYAAPAHPGFWILLARGIGICLPPVLVALYVGATTFDGGTFLPWKPIMVDLDVYRQAGSVLLAGGDFYDLPGTL